SLNPGSCWGAGATQGSDLLAIEPADCMLVFTGTVADGAACYDDQDCVSERCDRGSGCPGKCRTTVPQGGDCSGSGVCARGFVCVHSGSAAKCGLPGAVGAGCAEFEECQPGLVCTASKCAARPGLGGSCGVDVPCAGGFWCGNGGTCQPRVDAGGACTAASSDAFEGLGS